MTYILLFALSLGKTYEYFHKTSDGTNLLYFAWKHLCQKSGQSQIFQSERIPGDALKKPSCAPELEKNKGLKKNFSTLEKAFLTLHHHWLNAIPNTTENQIGNNNILSCLFQTENATPYQSPQSKGKRTRVQCHLFSPTRHGYEHFLLSIFEAFVIRNLVRLVVFKRLIRECLQLLATEAHPF